MIPSIRWGKMHESDAFAQYLEKKLSFTLVSKVDGIVEMSKGLKVIEIKCPYSVKDRRSLYQDCTLEDGQLCLNQSHAYYYQVQCTMAITGARECDFVVWTPMKVSLFASRLSGAKNQ